ncbi:MAG: hypothetical protein ACOC33_00720 [bacterium]
MPSGLIIITKKTGLNSPGGKSMINKIESLAEENNLIKISNNEKDKSLFSYYSPDKIEINNNIIEILKKEALYSSTIQTIYYHESLKKR